MLIIVIRQLFLRHSTLDNGTHGLDTSLELDSILCVCLLARIDPKRGAQHPTRQLDDDRLLPKEQSPRVIINSVFLVYGFDRNFT